MSKPSLNYYQALHVGKVKTDVIQFTSIQLAIDSITDNAAGKRYAVYVHPDSYSETVVMEDYIDLIAVGGREETIITRTCTADDQITVTGENSMIKGFTIISIGNVGGPFRTRCVSNAVVGFEIEDCVLTATGPAAAAITFNATASCDIRDCVIDSTGAAATGALFTTGGQTYNVSGTTFDAATDAIQVTTTPTLNLTDCTIADNLNQDGGTVTVVRSQLEALDCATAACTFSAELSRFTAGIATAGAFAHGIVLRICDLTGQGLASAATGATTMQMETCSHVGAVSNAGTGAFSIGNSDCTSVSQTNAAGSIEIFGGFVGYCLTSTGSVVWWINDDELKVLTTMKVAHALTAALAGDVIKLDQAVFAENNLTAKNGVDIVGFGSDLSIIEDTSGNPIITVGNNVACGFRGLRMSNLGAGAAVAIAANAAAATLSVQDCEFRSTASIITLTTAGAGAPSFTGASCIFRTGTTAIAVSGAVVANTIVRNSTFATCTLVFSTTGANHTFALDYCDCGAGGVTLTANIPVVTLSNCEDIGTFTHSTASTVTLNYCRLTGNYTTAAVAAVITSSHTRFADLTHNGGGTIALRSCTVDDIANNSNAAMNLHECVIGDMTQGAAAGSIYVYNCTVVHLITGATGRILLYGGCKFSDITVNAGQIMWQVDQHHWRVMASTANMRIMDAADIAVAGDTIEIGPGTFTEALDLDAAINVCTYKGFGRDKTIITQATGNTVLVDGIVAVVLEDLTINLTAGVDGNAAIKLDAATNATASVTLRNVTVNATWTAGTVYGVLAVDDGAARVATVESHNCKITCTGGANSYAMAANSCTVATSTISLYDCILNGATYDIYDNAITIDAHDCELNGAGWYIASVITAIGLASSNEEPATVTPVTFAGALGEFADLTGAELYTCLATVLISEAVYVSAANTVAEATNAVGAPLPAEGIVIYKPAGVAGTTCYVKNSGMAYMATPPAVWAAGTNVWLGVDGAQLVARPTNALKQVLGVGIDTKRMLINIASVEVATDFLNIPIAWGAGSAPTGTHTDGNSRRAVAIATAAQTVFSQAVAIPEGFLAFSKLYVTLFPTVTGNFDWTAYSSAASSGQDEATHSNDATADTQGETDDWILDHDISEAVTRAAGTPYTMVEKDIFSVELIIDALGGGTTAINVLGFRLEYTAQRGA